MKALIVYDSFFGNTEKIALAIGEVFGNNRQAGVGRVNEVKIEQLKDLELLIVGSPTRAFRPTPAIKTFLKNIPNNVLDGVKVAAFDTRTIMDDKVPGILKFFAVIFGYASKPIAEKLKKKGGELTIPPEGFFVKGTEGPLEEGELKRATDWAKVIYKFRKS
jgi:flavodoxin